MGQSTTRRGAAADGASEEGLDKSVDALLARVKGAAQERTEPLGPLGDVTLRPLMRQDHADLPITEESSIDDDQLHVVSATVVEPKLTAEEWGQLRDAMAVGLWGRLVQLVWEVNGIEPDFIKTQAARFREG